MKEGRLLFGHAYIGHFIYVVGGGDAQLKSLRSCEVYHMLHNEWKIMSTELPDICTMGITLLSVKQRFLYGFGSMGTEERVIRLDSVKLRQWEVVEIR